MAATPPPQLGLARKLVARGHRVRVLTEPSLRQDVLATGADYSSFTSAPHRQDRSRQSDLVRDFDARTPIGALAATRERVMFGPARAYATDTAAEIQTFRPHVLAVDWVLFGAAVAGEAAGVPTALLMHGNTCCPSRASRRPGSGSCRPTPPSAAPGTASSPGSSCDCSTRGCPR